MESSNHKEHVCVLFCFCFSERGDSELRETWGLIYKTLHRIHTKCRNEWYSMVHKGCINHAGVRRCLETDTITYTWNIYSCKTKTTRWSLLIFHNTAYITTTMSLSNKVSWAIPGEQVRRTGEGSFCRSLEGLFWLFALESLSAFQTQQL